MLFKSLLQSLLISGFVFSLAIYVVLGLYDPIYVDEVKKSDSQSLQKVSDEIYNSLTKLSEELNLFAGWGVQYNLPQNKKKIKERLSQHQDIVSFFVYRSDEDLKNYRNVLSEKNEFLLSDYGINAVDLESRLTPSLLLKKNPKENHFVVRDWSSLIGVPLLTAFFTSEQKHNGKTVKWIFRVDLSKSTLLSLVQSEPRAFLIEKSGRAFFSKKTPEPYFMEKPIVQKFMTSTHHNQQVELKEPIWSYISLLSLTNYVGSFRNLGVSNMGVAIESGSDVFAPIIARLRVRVGWVALMAFSLTFLGIYIPLTVNNTKKTNESVDHGFSTGVQKSSSKNQFLDSTQKTQPQIEPYPVLRQERRQGGGKPIVDAPPLPSELGNSSNNKLWYVAGPNKDIFGPYTEKQLEDSLEAGDISHSTYI